MTKQKLKQYYWLKIRGAEEIVGWLEPVQFSHSVVSDSLRPHEPQHAKPPCPSPTARVHPNPCPLSWWCHPTISSSVVPFSSCPQPFPASGCFQMSQLFASGGQSIGVSASTSVLPMNTQDWSPLGWTGLISLQPKGLSRVFFNTTVQRHPEAWANLLLWHVFLLVSSSFYHFYSKCDFKEHRAYILCYSKIILIQRKYIYPK